jgi:hypothetical protein
VPWAEQQRLKIGYFVKKPKTPALIILTPGLMSSGFYGIRKEDLPQKK